MIVIIRVLLRIIIQNRPKFPKGLNWVGEVLGVNKKK